MWVWVTVTEKPMERLIASRDQRRSIARRRWANRDFTVGEFSIEGVHDRAW
jgi:hypothetical protein